MRKIYLIPAFFLFSVFLSAQQDTINLEEVKLSDTYLTRFTDTQAKSIITDSVLERNSGLMTELLNFNSQIYFKENGVGGVASPSFRGTTAQQTAVVWNGININSKYNGQTDFNTVNPGAYDLLVIQPGGGSVAYGSSAIGGTINLNNEIAFNKGWENSLIGNYGSFDTYGIHLKSAYSNERISWKLNLGRAGSENDYRFPKKDQKNLNGQYYNNNLSVSAGYKINKKNTLKLFSNLFDGERHFSLISPNALRTKYRDYNTRSLVEWDGKFNKFTSITKVVFLSENFKYFPNIKSDNYEFGNAQSWIGKYDLGYSYKSFFFNLLADYTYTEAKGTSIENAKREETSVSLLLKHKINPNLLYEAGIRKEFVSDYKAPFLYSLGFKWNATSFYELRGNFSKNFRMPTFNDLFWPGSGNENLKPETSFQTELGNQIKWKDLTWEVLGYYNFIKELIQWTPVRGDLWIPENVGKVVSYGLETSIHLKKKWNHHVFDFNAAYSYTQSKDKRTDKQLIYVPFHKMTGSISYSFNRFSTFAQMMYNGKVFTDTKNLKELEAYPVFNWGAEYGFGKSNNYRIGTQIKNLTNKAYQNVLNRPMPGINYNFYINFKF